MALTINGIHRTNDKCHQRGEACISNQLVKEYPLKYENHSKFKSNFQMEIKAKPTSARGR